jgi:hypothetical protein
MAAPGPLLQLLRQVSRVRSPAVPEWGRAMLRRTAPSPPPRLPAPRTRQMVKASPLQRMYFLPSGRLRTEGRYTIEPAPLEALLAEVHGMEGAEVRRGGGHWAAARGRGGLQERPKGAPRLSPRASR